MFHVTFVQSAVLEMHPAIFKMLKWKVISAIKPWDCKDRSGMTRMMGPGDYLKVREHAEVALGSMVKRRWQDNGKLGQDLQ